MLCRRILQNCSGCTFILQKFSTAVNVNWIDEEKIKNVKTSKTQTKKLSGFEEVYNHLKANNLEYYIDFIPKKVLRKTNSANVSLYLINQDTAKTFCNLISKDLLKNACFVVESNPGLGFLTEELLNIGIPRINLYEKNSNFFAEDSPLSKLYSKHESRLSLKVLNFDNLWLMSLRDNYYEEQLADVFLKEVPSQKWTDKSYAQIITTCTKKQLLSLYIHNFFNQTSLFEHGRLTLYMAISSAIWERLLVLNNEDKIERFYSQFNVFLHLFFDWKCFGELPRDSFIPLPSRKANSTIDQLAIPLSIIKIEPKENVYEILQKEDMKPFWYFLKHGMRSKKNKIICELEKYIPGCGLKLITKFNIDILTAFKELSPEQLLEIFKYFKSLPEYDETFFVPVSLLTEEQKNEDEEQFQIEEKQDKEPSSESTTLP